MSKTYGTKVPSVFRRKVAPALPTRYERQSLATPLHAPTGSARFAPYDPTNRGGQYLPADAPTVDPLAVARPVQGGAFAEFYGDQS